MDEHEKLGNEIELAQEELRALRRQLMEVKNKIEIISVSDIELRSDLLRERMIRLQAEHDQLEIELHQFQSQNPNTDLTLTDSTDVNEDIAIKMQRRVAITRLIDECNEEAKGIQQMKDALRPLLAMRDAIEQEKLKVQMRLVHLKYSVEILDKYPNTP